MAMDRPTDTTEKMPPSMPAQGPDRRWRVLFISDHGKVFTFKRVKILIGLTAAAFLLSLIAVAVLMTVNQKLHGRNRDLQGRFKEVERKVVQLRQERDMLTAQVALVETRIQEVLAGGARPSAERKPPVGDPEGKATEKGPVAAAQAPGVLPAETGKTPEPAASRPAPADEGGIALEDLRVRHQRRGNTVEIKFRIRNTNSARKPLAGHVVAVLKREGLSPAQWMALPAVELVGGRPSGKQKGYSFSINHSITIDHSAPAPKSLPAYDAAVLYVFSKEGNLLFVKEFAADIQAFEE